MKFFSVSLLRGLAVGAAALALVGCAALAPATSEQMVTQRGNAYWQARIKGDYRQAYALTTPAYRELRTLLQFSQQFGRGGIASAEVVHVSCEQQKCVLRIKLGATPAVPGVQLGTIPLYLDDTWLLADGQWWHYQEP